MSAVLSDKQAVSGIKDEKKPLAFAKGLNMAGAERFELATPGFGDRCSTN